MRTTDSVDLPYIYIFLPGAESIHIKLELREESFQNEL